jgi:nucleoside-triphosphatase
VKALDTLPAKLFAVILGKFLEPFVPVVVKKYHSRISSFLTWSTLILHIVLAVIRRLITTTMSQPLHIILTGPPGVGKTTLITKICAILKEQASQPLRKVNIAGFYTSEIREGGSRVGFQVVTLDGEIGILSHVNSKSPKRIGRFGVEFAEFEKVALPQFELERLKATEGDNGALNILVIDEIGKMELFSEPFKSAVRQALATPNLVILATIPIKSTRGAPIHFVEDIRNAPTSQVRAVNVGNRNALVQEIVDKIIGTLK